MVTVGSIQTLLDQVLELSVPIESLHPAIGGSINQALIATLSDGRKIFIKTHREEAVPGMYDAEFRALECLASTGTLHVPQPIHHDEDYLVMEAFEPGAPSTDWQEKMGQGLAQLHRSSQGKQFGFFMDNYLGTTRQSNQWCDSWIDFWREQRLGHQLRVLEQAYSGQDSLLRSLGQLIDQLDAVLSADPESAVLLHGDLWSGNAAANAHGEPVIFDPASYYGHREAEFGMMRLFGGFTDTCEAAYQEIWPLQPGSNRRIAVYRLYHQLNHLNLFGKSYYAGCLSTLRNLL